MIQSRSPTVLHINKISVLLVCSMLLLLWLKFEFFKPSEQYSNSRLSSNTSGKPNNSENQSKHSKYLKTLSANPFLKSHDEELSSDLLPTVTSLQSDVPSFSSLGLRLHGIVYQPNRDSYAMISVNGAIQEIITTNGEIDEGLYLTKIAKKQVEVNYFGEQYVLLIDKSRRNEIVSAIISNNEIQQISSQGFEQQIEFLEVDKQRNPIRLFMIRRPYAVYSNGEFQGYKIMPGSNADQFQRLGFQSGDIITYLNGVEFTGPGMKEFVIQQLTHAMFIDLTVLRGDQELTINYGF